MIKQWLKPSFQKFLFTIIYFNVLFVLFVLLFKYIPNALVYTNPDCYARCIDQPWYAWLGDNYFTIIFFLAIFLGWINAFLLDKRKKYSKKKNSNQLKGSSYITKAVGLFGLIFLSFIFINFFSLMMLFSPSSREELERNPAKQLAAIMIPFAKLNNLEKIEEYNGAIGIDNTIPWFLYIYQGSQSMEDMHQVVKNYLVQHGYRIRENYYTPNAECPAESFGTGCSENILRGRTNNDGKPYWVLEGTNKDNDTVKIEINDKTYLDYASGEMSVKSGKVVMVIKFTSHDCIFCDVSPEDNKAKQKADLLFAPFIKDNSLEKYVDFANPESDEYTIIYQSIQTKDQLYVKLKQYFEERGYTVKENFYTYSNSATCSDKDCDIAGETVNGYQPYWVMNIDHPEADISIQGEITDRTYSANFYDAFGENPIPPGKTALKVTVK